MTRGKRIPLVWIVSEDHTPHEAYINLQSAKDAVAERLKSEGKRELVPILEKWNGISSTYHVMIRRDSNDPDYSMSIHPTELQG